jgi:gamma-aminobutyric acid type B receptor
MFMAFHTRRVDIKVLNDSKEIAVIVYINSIILALLTVVEFAFSKYHEVYTALFGLALLLEATVFLALVFIPKVSHMQDYRCDIIYQSATVLCMNADGAAF